jgi:hypothetical protein
MLELKIEWQKKNQVDVVNGQMEGGAADAL